MSEAEWARHGYLLMRLRPLTRGEQKDFDRLDDKRRLEQKENFK